MYAHDKNQTNEAFSPLDEAMLSAVSGGRPVGHGHHSSKHPAGASAPSRQCAGGVVGGGLGGLSTGEAIAGAAAALGMIVAPEATPLWAYVGGAAVGAVAGGLVAC